MAEQWWVVITSGEGNQGRFGPLHEESDAWELFYELAHRDGIIGAEVVRADG